MRNHLHVISLGAAVFYAFYRFLLLINEINVSNAIEIPLLTYFILSLFAFLQFNCPVCIRIKIIRVYFMRTFHEVNHQSQSQLSFNMVFFGNKILRPRLNALRRYSFLLYKTYFLLKVAVKEFLNSLVPR